MKWLKVIGLGILIWAMGLLWPTLHEALTYELMIVAVIGLSLVVLGLERHPHEAATGDTPCLPRPASDSRPIKPLGLV